MALNVRAYHSLEHPPVTFPEREKRSEVSADAAQTSTRDEREKFIEDWRRMLDTHLGKQRKEDDDQAVEISLVIMRELDTL